MKILLDTSAYSELRRGDKRTTDVIRRAEHIVFSSIVAGELLHGFRRGSRFERNRDDLLGFLDEQFVSFVDVTLVTADRFGRVAADLAARGTPIPTNDIWIAAHAFEHGAELITFDAHFERVPGLVWSRPGS